MEHLKQDSLSSSAEVERRQGKEDQKESEIGANEMETVRALENLSNLTFSYLSEHQFPPKSVYVGVILFF